MSKGTLYLLPNTLGRGTDYKTQFSVETFELVKTLDGLMAENPQNARHYLMHFELEKSAHNIPISTYNKKQGSEDIDFLFEPLEKGENWGYVSEAGLSCIADPGSELVKEAAKRGIEVKALIGPSSIFLALMYSGLPAQRFAFHGYLPREEDKAIEQMTMLEARAKEEGSVQIFMEVPHRNEETLKRLLATLSRKTELVVASNLTMPEQSIQRGSIREWRKHEDLPQISGPSLFLIG